MARSGRPSASVGRRAGLFPRAGAIGLLLVAMGACASAPGPARLRVRGQAAAVSDGIAVEMRAEGFRRNPGGVWERRDDVPFDPEGEYRFVLERGDRRTEYRVRCDTPRGAQAPADLVALVQIRLEPAGREVAVEVMPRFLLRTRGDRMSNCRPDSGLAARLGRIALGQE